MNPEDFPQQMPQGPAMPPAEDENEIENIPEGIEINAPSKDAEIPQQEGLEDITNPDTEPPAETPEHIAKEKKEKPEARELKIDREKMRAITETARNLVRELRERDQERMSPLIGDKGLSWLIAAIRESEELTKQAAVTPEEFENIMTKFTRAIAEIGQERRREVKDSPESLGKMASYLKRLGGAADALGASLAQTENKSERALRIIKHFEDTLDSKFLFIQKLRNALSRS